jgi:glucose-1-phosphate cytidylyltransferase
MDNLQIDPAKRREQARQAINQVVILCGGRGTRLKPMTDDIPKALVKLNGRPILDYILEFYHQKGFRKVVLCVGYKGDLIREYFKDHQHGLKIEFSDAGESASMLERIYAVKNIVQDQFFVAYGDTLIDLDMEGLQSDHREKKADVTIVTAKIQNPFGLVSYDSKQGLVQSFVEKPILNYYIGCFVMKKALLRSNPEKA